MTNPTAAQVLNRVAEYIEAAQQHYAAHDAGKYDSNLEHAYGCKRDELEDLDPAHLRALAQAHADQQDGIRQLSEYFIAAAETRPDEAKVWIHAHEMLKAVLGGKE